MKILLVSTYLPPAIGGVERTVWETAVKLSKRHDVHILTTGEDGTETENGITVHKIPYKKPLLLHYSIRRSIIKNLFKWHHFDIIHCHAGPWWKVLPKLISHDKLVITCQGADIYPKNLKSKLIVKPVLNSADAVVSISRWMCNYLKTEYGIDSTLIPNGINEKMFRPMNMKRDRNTILYAGRLIKKKGIIELLIAAKQLPQYNFKFAGQGKLSTLINTVNTEYLGLRTAEELSVMYNTATISIFPSHNEPFGIVGLEAMACGCPVIATNTGFADYMNHRESGILIDIKSSNQIIDSIKELMGDETLRERLGKNAINTARQYTWDIITRKYEKLYEDVIRNDIQN